MNNYLVITGASRGIGKATAKLYLSEGYSVINLSRSPCDIEGVINYSIDLAEPEWPIGFETKLLEQLQQADRTCLIHNAALLLKDAIDSLKAEKLRQVCEVNIVAPQRLNRLILPSMKSQSCILYVGSTLSEKAVGNSYSYVLSKHAGIGMMRSNCQDLVGKQIHTAAICPGFTDTEMLREHIGEGAENSLKLTEQVTQKRLIEPQEIAKTLFFCSENPVINGSIIHANLGQIES